MPLTPNQKIGIDDIIDGTQSLTDPSMTNPPTTDNTDGCRGKITQGRGVAGSSEWSRNIYA